MAAATTSAKKIRGLEKRNSKSWPDYSPPKTGFIPSLPPSWVPVAELARIAKPAGIYLFYFPHLFGTLFAACLTPDQTKTSVGFKQLVQVNSILLLGTALFRASACSWNDTMDVEFDRRVRSCRNRLLARGAVQPRQAHIVTVMTALLATVCLVVLPPACWVVAAPSIFLLWLYPFAKRFTDFPQAILGIQVAIGFLMGMAAQNNSILIEILHRETDRASALAVSIGAFYVAQAFRTVIYDTVYAQQDVEDDAKAGVRSIAIRFRGHTKTFLWSLAVGKVATHVGSFWLCSRIWYRVYGSCLCWCYGVVCVHACHYQLASPRRVCKVVQERLLVCRRLGCRWFVSGMGLHHKQSKLRRGSRLALTSQKYMEKSK
jgi:4-hydroxybenzoate polyprenyltransferase